MDDRTVKHLIWEIHQQLKPISELSASVVVRAELQSYTEDLYNQLFQLACEGMDFIAQLEVGQVIDANMIGRRDELVSRAQRLILDAPNTAKT